MVPIRVAPTRGEGSTALFALSKWASRHAERNKLISKKAATPEALIQRTHTRQLVAREKVFERHLPFSWLRFFVGFVSLTLVFSDVLRSGVGVSSLQAIYPALQPDEVVSFGTSWNYSVFASTKAEALNGSTTARVWSYKYDSTSVTWRAFASFFAVTEFPACFFYHSQCPDKTFGGDVAFAMIDSLVNAVSTIQKKPGTADSGPVGKTLRTENEYIDRLHQFILPNWFFNVNWRTNQALYYSPELLATSNARTICFPAGGNRVRNPRFCHELWTNFDRSCASTDTQGRAVGLLYAHTMDRLRGVQSRFPGLTIDLTFLESQEDTQICRGGLGSLGFRRSDVSAVIRARACARTGASPACETVYVEDYRYETGLLTSDVVQWYRLVAALRLVGQSYFLLRGVGLMLSCYFVHGVPKSKKTISTWTRLRKARHLFMKVPTQCVVFGSPFPVACYVFAHLLDAPLTYNVLESQFFSQDGFLDIQLEAFVSYAVVQMRNVWIYALIWHVVVSVTTSRWLARSNQLNSGIIGVPEFLLSGFSSVTLLSQYRSTSFRSSKILELMEMPDSLGIAWVGAKYQYSFSHRGGGSVLLGGVVIDLKLLICLIFVIAGAWAVHVTWMRYWTSKHLDKHRYSHWFILAPTPVPYSAGVLWPTVSICVHWTSDFFCIRDEHHLRQWHHLQPHLTYPLQGHKTASREGRVIPFSATFRSKHLEELRLQVRRHRYKAPSARMSGNTFRYIQHQMKCLHGRSDDVEANVAFMNAVLMSDPLVYLRTLLGRDRSTELAYYQSLLRPHQVVLLPVVVVGEHNEYSSGLKLLRRVNASELTWPELVQCG
jgi:hypothetical protein